MLIPYQTPTRVSGDAEVGVKCVVARVCGQASLHFTGLVLCLVVRHEVELHTRVGLGDLLQRGQELLALAQRLSRGREMTGGDLYGYEQCGGPVVDVVVNGYG